MSAEFDDVLTNQPVVIDNVCSLSYMKSIIIIFKTKFQNLSSSEIICLSASFLNVSRALGLSRLALQVKIIQNASFLHCACYLYLIVIWYFHEGMSLHAA